MESGQEVIIGRAGKPVARLVPFSQAKPQREPGTWKGKVKIKPGFYEADKEIEKMFYGRGGLRLLLDTNILLWWLMDAPRLSTRHRAIIADAEVVFVSPVSAWEIEIKRAAGKLSAPDDLDAAVRRSNLVPLNVSITHVIAAGRLPSLHRDPFDRMLVAQASIESLTLVTSNAPLQAYRVPVILA